MSLDRAVAICRALATGNPDNVELRVAVALALIERGDARVALSRQTVARPDDRTAAERLLGRGVDPDGAPRRA